MSTDVHSANSTNEAPRPTAASVPVAKAPVSEPDAS
jgi:hypothetical protein